MWKMILSIIVSINFLTVLCAVKAESSKSLEHEPYVAFWCGKVNQHVDLKTGQWVTDKNGKSMCATDKEQVLGYCQHTYPTLNIKNIVESNNQITINNWCDPYNVNCTASKKVITYRCLAGRFEADALLVPKGCHFGHIHEGSRCESHDSWHDEATATCHNKGMILKSYGVLIPCGTGMFTGVEFVCCPNDVTMKEKVNHPIMRLIGGREDVNVLKPKHSEHPVSVVEKLEKEIKKYHKHVAVKSFGCDHTKYHRRRQEMEEEHSIRMSKVIKEWENAEQRHNALKDEDPKQAEEMISGVMDRFKKIVALLENQAKLERMNLHEEHVQCMQIDLNDKKNKVLRLFLKALKKNPPDENAILGAMRQFINVSTEDRIHNHHHFERMIKNYPENAQKLRKNFQAHLKHINDKVNHTMTLLYKVPKIARKFVLELPPWVPKPDPVPTEKPTTEAPTEAPTEKEHKDVHERNKNRVKHHHQHGGKHQNGGISHVKKFFGIASQKKDTKQHDDESEDEETPRSPATFAIVIGLSCGALVIMIVIVIAMAMRKSRGNNPTRTVLVDPDADCNSEKQHLANLQQNGYENPIYKLSSY